MTKHSRSRAFAFVAAMALAAGGCVINLGADQVVVREEKRFTVGPGAEVTLDTFDGSIQVQSWDQSEVRVEIEKRGPDRETAAALEARTSQEGNRVRVEAPAPKVRRSFGIGNVSSSVGFIVRVPQNVKLTAITRDGSITVEGVKGATSLRSGDGSIRGRDLDGELTVRTEDGSLTLENVNGRLSLESGDGSIRVDGRFDSLQARTNDGSIVIEADEGSAMQADWDVSTGDGSITVRVPRNFSADVDADSGDGRVSSDFEGLEGSAPDDDHGRLRGRIGSGGHKLTLRSGDGSITIGSR